MWGAHNNNKKVPWAFLQLDTSKGFSSNLGSVRLWVPLLWFQNRIISCCVISWIIRFPFSLPLFPSFNFFQSRASIHKFIKNGSSWAIGWMGQLPTKWKRGASSRGLCDQIPWMVQSLESGICQDVWLFQNKGSLVEKRPKAGGKPGKENLHQPVDYFTWFNEPFYRSIGLEPGSFCHTEKSSYQKHNRREQSRTLIPPL